MSCVSWGSRPVSSVITCTGPPMRAAMSMSTDDSAWKLATIASFGNEACAHRSTASGSSPDKTSGGVTRSIGRGAYRLERLREPDRPRNGLLIEHGARSDPGLHLRRQIRKVGEQAARHDDGPFHAHPRTCAKSQRGEHVGGAVDDPGRARIERKRIEHHAGERRPLPGLAIELHPRYGLEQVVAFRGDEHSLTQDAELHAFLPAAHQLAQSFAHDPHAAALVAEHPSPSAGPPLVAAIVARVRDRPCARDERDPDVEAGGGEDEPGVA